MNRARVAAQLMLRRTGKAIDPDAPAESSLLLQPNRIDYASIDALTAGLRRRNRALTCDPVAAVA
jgi:hypothetical protein